MKTAETNQTSTADSAAGLTILVVDDESAIGDYMKTVLSAEGHNVLFLDSYDDAIEHMRHVRFDVAFIGAVMPGQAGSNVAALVKTLSPETTVLLFTEPVTEELAEGLRRGGFDVEALTCPFETPHLLGIIESIKAKRSRIQKNHSPK